MRDRVARGGWPALGIAGTKLGEAYGFERTNPWAAAIPGILGPLRRFERLENLHLVVPVPQREAI